MKPLRQKLAQYTYPQEMRALGIYPYFTPICSEQNTEVYVTGHDHPILMFGSNSYLGLTNDPRLKEAAKRAIDKYGTGCAGSPFLNGTLDIHIQLQDELAEFLGKDGVMLFSAGFLANSGVIPNICGRGDYLFYDERVHASIMEGRLITIANTQKYRHNDMADLERVLSKAPLEASKLVVTDGVFSMEGDVAHVDKMVEICDKYGATLMVDEAHGLGVFGREGRGTCDHYNMLPNVDLVMGTFSKSLASIGGFIAADSSIINWLRHTVRTYIFSASSTPAATACAREALHIIQNEPQRLKALWDVTNYALRRFREEGFEIGDTESPIIPLYVRDTEKTFKAVAYAFREGVFINPVIPPACAPQDTLVRYALMATHTNEQVDESVEKLKKVFQELDILPTK